MEEGTASGADHRAAATLRFPAERIRLREAALACLQLDSPSQLAALPPDPKGGTRGGNRGASTRWIRRWQQRSPAADAEFEAAYLELLRQVVLPTVGDSEGILYQRQPTFRCHVPGSCNGKAHTDAEYGHSAAELNYWLPLTPVWDSNSLYVESEPGRADYQPWRLEYGELGRFWGSQCRHFTVPNTTGCSRVSFDFRVMPRRCYSSERPGKFKLGGFFGWMGPDGNEACEQIRSRRAEQAAARAESGDQSPDVDASRDLARLQLELDTQL